MKQYFTNNILYTQSKSRKIFYKLTIVILIVSLLSKSIRVLFIHFNLQKPIEGLTESSIHDTVDDPIKTCVEISESRPNIYQHGRVRLRVTTRLHDPPDIERQ